ncbi:hypothetical protein SCP_0211310 [Sparassis crispa]|uniref:Uncharacterized protein n=1 Tax=Sparassis crispa TaxID=139825 RepID=A0A401GCM5_9APHY|nr:hypothetical protein SCP_0211310 [Sparassis crispa]GBE79929.1 hypothetical protein SCP_0211310 [Sparassis crispa]
MLQQFYEIRDWNLQLRAENQKLFSDNRGMAKLIAGQNERLAQLRASPEHQSRIIIELQNQLRIMEANREVLVYDHHRALEEIVRLRNEVAHLGGKMGLQSVPIVSKSDLPALSRDGDLAENSIFMGSRHRNNSSVDLHIDTNGLPRPIPVPPEMSASISHPPLSHRASPYPRSLPRRQHTHDGTKSLPATPMVTIPPATTMPLGPFSAGPRAAANGSHLIPKQENVIDLTLDADDPMDGTSRKRRRVSEELPHVVRTAQPVTSQEPLPPPEQHAMDGIVATSASTVAPISDVAPDGTVPAGEVPPEVIAVGTALKETGSLEVTSDSVTTASQTNDVVSEERQILQECVEENFEEGEGEDEGRLFCGISRHFARGTEEPPQPFVDATLEELVAHCEHEHPRGWERLKDLVKQHQDSV